MYNLIVRKDRQPFDFEHGLKVRGKLIGGVQGATLFGCSENGQHRVLQLWLLAIQQTVTQITSQLGTFTSPDQPLTDWDNSTANTKFVQDLIAEKLAALVAGAPAALNTLGKLARALNNKPQLATDLMGALANLATKLDIQRDTVSMVNLTAAGSIWRGTISPDFTTALRDAMVVIARAPAANVLDASIELTGTTSTTAYPVVLANGRGLRIGDIPHAGYWMHLQWNQPASKWMLINPASAINQRFATVAESVAGTLTQISVMPAGVRAAIATVVGASAGAIDTLAEMATALGGQGNLSAQLMTLLAQKAPLASPVFNGGTTPDTPTTLNDDTLINTRSVQILIAQWGNASQIPDASLTVVGKVLLSDLVKAQMGVTENCAITPAILKSIAGGYLNKFSPVLTGIPRAPTPNVGTFDLSSVTTEFVYRHHLQSIQPSTISFVGLLRYASEIDVDAGVLESVAISPKLLKYAISQIPTLPNSSITTLGKARLATEQESIDGVDNTTWLTPKTMRALINSKLAAYGGSFAAPAVTGAATASVGVGYVITVQAMPAGLATSIASFNITLKSRDSASWQVSTGQLSATNNQLTYTFTPTQAHVGISQIQVVAKDNLGYSSPLASKDFTVEQVVVKPPVFVFPLNNQQDINHTPTLEVTGFGLSVGVGSHAKTDWKLELLESDGSGFLLMELNDSTTFKTQVAVADSVLATGYTYRLSVRFHDQTHGPSTWSISEFTVMPPGSLNLIQKIVAPTPVASAQYGYCVTSRDGVWLAIRSTGHKSVFIYKWNATSSSYEYKQTFVTDDAEPTKFTYGNGFSMTPDGLCLVVACPLVLRSVPLSGSFGYTYVYTRNGDVWTQTARIQALPVDTSSVAVACNQVAIDRAGNVMAIQVPIGAICIYKKDVNGVWNWSQDLMYTVTSRTFAYGMNMAFSANSNVLAVSHAADTANGSLGGNMYMYEMGQDGLYSFHSSFCPPVTTTTETFSAGMALHPSGEIIYVGSPNRTIGTETYCGAIEVFKKINNVWTHQSTWNLATPIKNANVGRSLCLDERARLLAVGACYPTTTSTDRGRAILISIDETGLILEEIGQVLSPNQTINTSFATQVFLSPIGRRLFICQATGTDTVSNQGICHVHNC